MERQPQYQGIERRQSQSPYQGDERRKGDPAMFEEPQDRTQQDAKQQQRNFDDTQ